MDEMIPYLKIESRNCPVAPSMMEKTRAMSVETDQQTLGFQTEVTQLLQLMIHSLYSNKEIFLRELVSNAADATDKLRFEALATPALLEEDPQLRIRVSADQQAGTITIEDNGIGMSRDETISHLGTIAKSGTHAFLQSLNDEQKKDSNLIGQFGVGFYSAFIVAKQVDVWTRRAGLAADQGVCWSSEGKGQFSIQTVTKPERGTRIVLHLKEDDADLADHWRLRSILRKYSDHIGVQIEMPKEPPAALDADKKSEQDNPAPVAVEWEIANQANALWTRAKTDITTEDYHAFYKHISHDIADPLAWSHNKVEGKLEYTSLLYIPARAPFDLYHRDAAKGLKLYVQRVFIMDRAEQFLPLYLRFVKGIVDSSDLSLNVSRELLQSGPVIDAMKAALTKRSLELLAKLAKDEPEKYTTFWKQFGQVLKEGPAEDFTNREKIAGLLRFVSTHADASTLTSLDGYIQRMQPGQDKIYYLTGESYTQVKHSPHLEVFRQKNIEVLLLIDRIDEWLMSYLTEYQGKSLVDIARSDLDLGAFQSDEDKKTQEEIAKSNEGLATKIKQAISADVADVRVSHRLTDSPAILALAQGDMGAQMRHLLEASGQQVPESKPIFEFNPTHPLIKKLDGEQDMDRFNDLCHILFDQAALAAGNSLKDPGNYVARLNTLLLELSAR